MSFFKGLQFRTIFTIIIAAIIISAALAGGNWGLGYADTTPTIPIPISIDPDVVHVNSAGFTATISGSDFVGTLYTKVFFQEPDGDIHEFFPTEVYDCATEYQCSTLTVYLPYDLFFNVGIADIWIKNYSDDGSVTGISTTIHMSIIDELYLPIVMKNN